MILRPTRLLAGLVLLCCAATARADDWPQWLGPKRDGVWRETGILEKFPQGGPKVRWRLPIGAGYAGPAVADGKVFVTDRVLNKGAENPESPFKPSRVEGKERVLCIDATTGKILWKHEYVCPYAISYASGPRTTPVVAGGKVWTLGAMGDLLCLDAAKGDVIWKKNLPEAYQCNVPFWGFAGHPLLDGDRLICLVGGKGSVAVAFNKDTGAEIWKALSAKEPGYAPPMIYQVGGKRRLVLWDPEHVSLLDPENGKVFWSVPFGMKKAIKAGMSIPTPRRVGADGLFLSAFYDGCVMFKLNGDAPPKVAWEAHGRSEQADDTEGLHCVMSTPFIHDGYIYGVCSYGALRCLKADTGERLWANYKPTTGEAQRWGNAFLTQVGDSDRYFLFNERGELLIAKLTPKGYTEIDRAKILNPDNTMAGPKGRRVDWSCPAYAGRAAFARNDHEIICVELAADRK